MKGVNECRETCVSIKKIVLYPTSHDEKNVNERFHLKAMIMLNKKVLVLNQSYEPLCISNVRRTVIMLYLGKAEVIELIDHRFLRSLHLKIPVPSIVRLLLYKKVPDKKVILSRKNIMIRDNCQCQYCGKKNIELTIDHVLPRDRGGYVAWENLVCACVKCNSGKGNKTPEEAGMTLLNTPRKPNYVSFLRYFVDTLREEWKPYLFMH